MDISDISPHTGQDIRRKFLDYFVANGHTKTPSSSLVPSSDPTLLFINAGMVPFKNVFTGKEKRPYTRAASSQKCLRVSGKHNDLEAVGRTARHQTFFEMLGNFSFGDYFKEQAIEYGWEFLTSKIGLPEEKLYVTVFREDDEAYSIWEKKIGVPAARIARMGEKDNFWSMGDTGPCGPCSEIHIDRGEGLGCGRPECSVECECDRYIELWNLVFMQFDRAQDGTMTPLPNPSIDTGMGLERLASVVQGKPTNFDTDLILPVIKGMEEMTDHKYGASPETDVSFRVIGDHIRALAFLVADGVNPSNEGRGYVLRRIMRRALRHGRMLGVTDPFAYRLAPVVVGMMKDAYPELLDFREAISGVALAEERSFSATLEYGMKTINELIEEARAKKSGSIEGEDLFKLYDTRGFPLDLARDIAEDAGLDLDMEGFKFLMTQQQEQARKSWKGAAGEDVPQVYKTGGPTTFTGYDEKETEGAAIAAIIAGGELKGEAAAGGEVEIIFDKTPFYAESGGQVGDEGVVKNDAFHGQVVKVSKPDGQRWVHTVKVVSGEARAGDKVDLKVDHEKRSAIRRNHSATHLLHAALRQVIGAHVKQAGSLVGPDKLRFDYTHFTQPDKMALETIEEMVNRRILENLAVATSVKSVEEAVNDGATALFGEKYGESVRVVKMGEFSMELCGGTHAGATGDIGLFRIVSEGGVAAGVRRIEAVTGLGALHDSRGKDEELGRIGVALKTGGADLAALVAKQGERVRELEKENRALKEKLASGGGQGADETQIEAGGKTFRLVAQVIDGADAQTLRSFIDDRKNRIKSGVVAAGARQGGKALLAVGVTDDLVKTVQAGKIIKELAGMVGGGGGGRADFAQAGGKDPDKLEEAIKAAPDLVKRLAGG